MKKRERLFPDAEMPLLEGAAELPKEIRIKTGTFAFSVWWHSCLNQNIVFTGVPTVDDFNNMMLGRPERVKMKQLVLES